MKKSEFYNLVYRMRQKQNKYEETNKVEDFLAYKTLQEQVDNELLKETYNDN